MKEIPKKKLNNRTSIPILGFGSAGLKGTELLNALNWAFDCGYRHIDTADYYGNHKDIGEFLSRSGLKREKFFITSKVWKTDLKKNKVKSVLKRSLDELETDYIDLFLIHAPNDKVSISETLEAMKDLLDKNLIHSIGISNFDKVETKAVLDSQNHWKTEYEITNSQIEYNISNKNPLLLRYSQKNNITVTAYSPFNGGNDLKKDTVLALAEKYKKSEAQIILRWLIQKGMIVIPRSSKYDHLKENTEIFDWELSSKDLNKLDESGNPTESERAKKNT